jgi:hypothetical protein
MWTPFFSDGAKERPNGTAGARYFQMGAHRDMQSLLTSGAFMDRITNYYQKLTTNIHWEVDTRNHHQKDYKRSEGSDYSFFCGFLIFRRT